MSRNQIDFAMSRRALQAILPAALLMLVFAGQSAHACTCAQPDATWLAEFAAIVFRGKVLHSTGPKTGEASTTFAVQRQWKGDPVRKAVVRARVQSAACGIRFKPGESYLVFASEKDGVYRTNSCSTFSKGAYQNRLEHRVDAWKKNKEAN